MRHLRKLTWKAWALGALVLVVLAGVVVAQNIYGIRDDAGTTATQPVSGDIKPIRISTNSKGHMWVEVSGGTVTETSTAAPVAKNWVMGGAVVAAGPAPAPLAASSTFARKVIMTAVKAAGTANTSVVYIGDANLIDTSAACIQLAPGDSFTLEGSPGTKFDLNLLKIDGATAADGVRYIYQPI